MQLHQGAQWKRVSATEAGSTIIKASSSVLYNVVIGQSKTGTVSIYDNGSGTSAATLLSNVDNTVVAGGVPNSLEFNARLRNGLTVAYGGTVDMLFMYQ